MNDKNYWKDAYKNLWAKADEKERKVKEIIENLLGAKLTFYGLGAGSVEYIDGSAEENNQVKGDPDLYVEKYDTFIEVTGPMIKVSENAALWIRPDKVRNAINKIENKIGQYHFVIHVANLKSGITLYRAIRLDKTIEDSYRENTIKYITPKIRGIQEKYLEIPHDHKTVFNLIEFKNILEN
jgi:hypothetical protein